MDTTELVLILSSIAVGWYLVLQSLSEIRLWLEMVHRRHFENNA